MPIKPERIAEAAKRLKAEAEAAPGSVEEYIRRKLEAVREAALKRSRTHTEPAVPMTTDRVTREDAAALARLHAEGVREDLRQMRENYEEGLDYMVDPRTFGGAPVRGGTVMEEPGFVEGVPSLGYMGKHDSDAYNHWRLAMQREAARQDAFADMVESDPNMAVPGLSCIYDATNQYGPQYLQANNREFLKNPVGFIQIPFSEARPGDIIQDDLEGGYPVHGMILNSIDDSGVHRYNYSNGESGPGALVRNGLYYPIDDTERFRNAFRFVGTPADSLRWRREFESGRFSCGGKMYGDGGEEGRGFLQRFMQTRTTQPAMPGVATSAMVANRDIPRVNSTVGDDLSYAGALLSAPQMLATIPERGAYGIMQSAIENKNIDPTLTTKALGELAKQLRRKNEIDKMKRMLPTIMAMYRGVPDAVGDTASWILDALDVDYSKGGKIHIKPENRGRFTALKKRTGHSASWFKAHGTPAQKKMAVFALNSRHWGNRKDGGGTINVVPVTNPAGVLSALSDATGWLSGHNARYDGWMNGDIGQMVYESPSGIYDLSQHAAPQDMDFSVFGLNISGDAPEFATGPAAYRMASAIDRNKDLLMKNLGLTDSQYAEDLRTALALGMEESGLGTSETYLANMGNTMPSKYVSDGFSGNTGRSGADNLKYAAEAFVAPLKGIGEKLGVGAESKGMTNLKYYGDSGSGYPLFSKEEMRSYGLSGKPYYDRRVMESPEVSGVMTMLAIDKKRKEIDGIMSSLPDELRNDAELRDALLYQSWVQGTDMIRKTADMVVSGERPAESLLQFKDASLRNGNDGSWYADRIKGHRGYLGSFGLGGYLVPYGNMFNTGGTVSEVWKERTGKDWKEVGKYYDAYDRTAKGNLALLGALNRGEYDYLKTGNSRPQAVDAGTVATIPYTFSNPSDLTKEQVGEVQAFLKNAGYDIGPTGVDQIFGPRTTRAYQRYLIDNGISVGKTGADSVFGAETEKASGRLAEEIASNGFIKEVPVAVPAGSDIRKPASEKLVIQDVIEEDKPKKETKRGVSVSSLLGFESGMPGFDSVYHDPLNIDIDTESIENGKTGEGLSNIGQLYNERYDNFVTKGGINLSNVRHSDENLVSPQVFGELYGGKMKYNSVSDASTFGKGVVNKGDKIEQRCSAFIQDAASRYYGWNYVKANGMNGDAWKIGDNMVEKGGDRYFNLFSSDNDSKHWMDYICKEFGVSSEKELYSKFMSKGEQKAVGKKMFAYASSVYNKNRKKYKEKILSSVKEGDVVELMYNGSPHSVESMRDTSGKHPHTHVGYIVKVGDEFYIQDNTSGNVHTRRLSDVLDNKDSSVRVAGLVRPMTATGKNMVDVSEQGRSASTMSDFGVYPNMDGKNRFYRLDNDVAYRMMGALYNNREVLSEKLGLSPDEYNMLAGAVHCMAFKESQNGQISLNKDFLEKKGTSLKRQYGDEYADSAGTSGAMRHALVRATANVANGVTGGLLAEFNPSFNESTGLTQIKFEGKDSPLTNGQKEELGTEGRNALSDVQPETSAVASMMAMANNYKILMDAFRTYGVPDELRDEEHIVAMLGKMYNEGPSIVVQTLANADYYGGQSEDRVQTFIDRYDKMRAPGKNGLSYMNGMADLYKMHDYKLFSSEDMDEYENAMSQKSSEQRDAIMNMVVENPDLLPIIHKLISRMSVRDAKRYGAAAARDADTVEAYKTGHLVIDADKRSDKMAARAYTRAFKKTLKGSESKS